MFEGKIKCSFSIWRELTRRNLRQRCLCQDGVFFSLSSTQTTTSAATPKQTTQQGTLFRYWRRSVFTRSSMCCAPTFECCRSWMSIKALFACASGSVLGGPTRQHGVGHKLDTLWQFYSALVRIGKYIMAGEVIIMRRVSPEAHTNCYILVRFCHNIRQMLWCPCLKTNAALLEVDRWHLASRPVPFPNTDRLCSYSLFFSKGLIFLYNDPQCFLDFHSRFQFWRPPPPFFLC